MSSDAEILARIAQLTGAIKQHRESQVSGRGTSFRGGVSSGWGATRGRGRGRGSMSLSNVPSPVYPPRPTYSAPSYSANKSLVLNQSSPNNSLSYPTQSFSANKSLVLNNPSPYKPTTATTNSIMSMPLTTKPLSALMSAKTPTIPPSSKRVTVEGVHFIVKGKKLVREDVFHTATKPTRLSKIMKSRKPLRTKKGHMVFFRKPEGYVRQGNSLVLSTKTRQKRSCGTYTRYGKCPREKHCAFQHDRARRAICPRFVRQQCSKTPEKCFLSHTPTPHIMPHCLYFQRERCTNDECLFPHVSVSPDAPVCKSFALEGYCSKGLSCHSKHVHVCPEFAESSKCSNANCRLPHVAQSDAKDSKGVGAHSRKATGIVRPGQWMSNDYLYKQRMKKAEQKRSEDTKEDVIPIQPAHIVKEDEGYVPLFDDEGDDVWFQKLNDNEEPEALRFSDHDESGDESEEEMEMEMEMEIEMEDGEDREEDYNEDREEGCSEDSEDGEVYYEAYEDENGRDEMELENTDDKLRYMKEYKPSNPE
ncbi:hypothetical protein BDF14DRAFT_1869661 [Spinellus fusiger]|nr:hypothetical protein BDF14DRAFT_1869661 [Spinellus fusiger]